MAGKTVEAARGGPATRGHCGVLPVLPALEVERAFSVHAEVLARRDRNPLRVHPKAGSLLDVSGTDVRDLHRRRLEAEIQLEVCAPHETLERRRVRQLEAEELRAALDAQEPVELREVVVLALLVRALNRVYERLLEGPLHLAAEGGELVEKAEKGGRALPGVGTENASSIMASFVSACRMSGRT